MTGAPRPLASSRPEGRATPGPSLVPCLLLRGGQVLLPGEEGPTVARTATGTLFDPFDVVDRLAESSPLLYVVDLDGIERGDPQLDYLQEISRDVSIWVDAGVRSAEQAIDVLVTGARRVVLSSAHLNGPRELRRTWRLSTEVVFELELVGAKLAPAHEGWGTEDPVALAATVRDVGVDHLVVSPRGSDPDWPTVRSIAAAGPTWVDGTFSPGDARRLTEVGASGGIYHLNDLLARWEEKTPTLDDPPRATRDDENQNQLTHDE